MQTTLTHRPNWWVGSNGNLFGDFDGFRYCIARLSRNEYSIARNGIEIDRAPSMARAKLCVKRAIAPIGE